MQRRRRPPFSFRSPGRPRTRIAPRLRGGFGDERCGDDLERCEALRDTAPPAARASGPGRNDRDLSTRQPRRRAGFDADERLRRLVCLGPWRCRARCRTPRPRRGVSRTASAPDRHSSETDRLGSLGSAGASPGGTSSIVGETLSGRLPEPAGDRLDGSRSTRSGPVATRRVARRRRASHGGDDGRRSTVAGRIGEAFRGRLHVGYGDVDRGTRWKVSPRRDDRANR